LAALTVLLVIASPAAQTTITPKLLLETADRPIRDVTVAPDGSIFTFDYREYRIKKFDRNGRFITEFGGTGKEEGRFTHLTGLAAFEGRLLAVDSIGISTFELNGAFVARTQFPEEITPDLSMAFEDGRYVGTLIVASELLAVLTLRSPQGRELDRLASYDLRDYFPELTKGEDFFLSNEYARHYLYALDSDGSILWAPSDASCVYRYRDGKSRLAASADLTPMPLPETVIADLQKKKDALKPPLHLFVPAHYPLIRHLAVGPDGDVWAFVQSREKTGFLRFSKDGKEKGFALLASDFDPGRAVVRVYAGRMYFVVGRSLYAADLPEPRVEDQRTVQSPSCT
jgi:hypothetical protein